MANHSEFVALSKELLKEEGRKVILQVLSTNAADTNKPWNGPATPSVLTQYEDVYSVVVPPFGRELGSLVNDVDLFKKAEKVLLVQPVAEGLEETVNCILDTDSSVWRVIVAQALKPSEQTILYAFGVAR